MATSKRELFLKRRLRVRNKLRKLADGRARLSVHRSSKNISVQPIDDARGVTLAAASSLEKDLGIVGNGTNDTIGDHDEDRVAELIEKAVPVYEATGAELKADLKPEDIVTNEFIDTSIKL